jgi:hypothetical protein
LDVDVVRSLAQISRRLATHGFRTYSGNQASTRKDKLKN